MSRRRRRAILFIGENVVRRSRSMMMNRPTPAARSSAASGRRGCRGGWVGQSEADAEAERDARGLRSIPSARKSRSAVRLAGPAAHLADGAAQRQSKLGIRTRDRALPAAGASTPAHATPRCWPRPRPRAVPPRSGPGAVEVRCSRRSNGRGGGATPERSARLRLSADGEAALSGPAISPANRFRLRPVMWAEDLCQEVAEVQGVVVWTRALAPTRA